MTGSLAGLTDVGGNRERNEDGFLLLDVATGDVLSSRTLAHPLLDSPLLLAVSDGMGGASAGEVASALTLDVFQDHARRSGGNLREREQAEVEAWLAEGVETADHRVKEAVTRDGSMRGMGATLTAGAVLPDFLSLCHVGDSRAYRVRDGEVCQLTSDHTFVGQMVARGHLSPEEARVHAQRHVLLQAVGAGKKLTVDTASFPLRPKDRFLLCTDGFHDLVSTEAMAEILSVGDDPMKQCRELVSTALSLGAHDNVTVVVLHVA